jgi:hypothetical protein
MRRRTPLLNNDLVIGNEPDAGEISIPYSARAAHLHAIGRTRSGKSRFLADLITQDIRNLQGVTVFDPHSELYDYLVRWLSARPRLVRNRKLHLVDFSDESSVFSFNPLKIRHDDEAYGVASVLTEGLSKVFGNPKATDTPLIDATLNTIFVLLAHHRLPVAAAYSFLHERHAEVRSKLAEGHPNEYYRELGRTLATKKGKQFNDIMESSERRLRKLIGNPMMRRVFSQTTDTIDFREAMDRRDLLLFNLRPRDKRMSREGMQAIGTILLNTIFADAFTREPADKPIPHMLYVDEVQNYVNDDIEAILTEASKVGLYLSLSHQTLAQLRAAGDEIYSAVMACTLLKSVFSVSHQDAMEFVDDLFGDQIHPERIKENILTPHVVGHHIEEFANRTKGGGRTESRSRGHSHGLSFSRSTSETEAESEMQADVEASGHTLASGSMVGRGTTGTFSAEDDNQTHYSVMDGESSSNMEAVSSSTASINGRSTTHATSRSRGTSNSHAVSFSQGTAETSSWSEGYSEGLVSDIKWLKDKTWTLEDQRYDFAQIIARAEPRHGLFTIVNQGTIAFKTRDMPDLFRRPKAEAQLFEQSLSSGSIKLVEHADPDPLSEHLIENLEDDEVAPVFSYRIDK